MKHLKLLLLTAIILTTSSIYTFAQDDDNISVETNLVTLNVAVTDKNGNYIKDLKSEDFVVFDDKTKQQIEQFSSEDAPVYFGIVYDLSSTTGERSQNVLAALRQFTGQLKQTDNYFVTVFNERGSLTTDFVPNDEHIRANLTNTKPNTPNSLYDAVYSATEKMRGHKDSKQILLILTDGKNDASRHSLKELRQRLRSVNLPVYTVNFNDSNERLWNYSDIYRGQQWRALDVYETNELNKAALAEISKTSGGQSFEKTIYNRLYLYTIFTKILTEVENQYVIGFYPETSDGKWHKLKVSLSGEKAKTLRLSNRKGYQSPKN
ncbi:MAG: VWA domain-containing protein [Pyrinomonadaceae bacterium]